MLIDEQRSMTFRIITTLQTETYRIVDVSTNVVFAL
jgi:hypothetical protein